MQCRYSGKCEIVIKIALGKFWLSRRLLNQVIALLPWSYPETLPDSSNPASSSNPTKSDRFFHSETGPAAWLGS
jgi:hypothetical protein